MPKLRLPWRWQIRLEEIRTYHGRPLSSLKRYVRNTLAKRADSPIAYVYTDPGNSGDYASHLGIRCLAQRDGVEVFCRDAISVLSYPPANGRRWKGIIVGGGGLLQPVFEDFWRDLFRLEIPTALFGVGANVLLPERPEVSTETVQTISENAVAIHVRDDFTRNLFSSFHRKDVTVGLCPSVNHLHELSRAPKRKPDSLLHVYHPVDLRFAGLDSDSIRTRFKRMAGELGLRYVESDHLEGMGRSLLRKYEKAAVVISSRLHGCIFSYGLGRPFVPIACDSKTSAFLETHVPGTLCVSPTDVEQAIDTNLLRELIASPLQAVPFQKLQANAVRMKEVLSLFESAEEPELSAAREMPFR